MAVLKLLSNQGFISYNKIVAKKLGVHEAILLGELCSIFMQFNCNEFYFTQDKICNDTALSVKQVRDAIKTLETVGFLTITKKGVPCKNWYLLNEPAIIAFFDKNDNEIQSSCEESEQLDEQNLPNKKSENSVSSEAKTDAQLNKNTSKNTRVRIQNSSCEPTAEKKLSKTALKKSQSLRKQEEIQSYLNSLSETDSLTFDKCVSVLFEFKKSKDDKFNRSHTQLTEWKFKFAKFSEESTRTPVEILSTVSFAISDPFWSQYLFGPDNIIKSYDKIIFAKSKQQSYNRPSYQKSQKQWTDDHLIL